MSPHRSPGKAGGTEADGWGWNAAPSLSGFEPSGHAGRHHQRHESWGCSNRRASRMSVVSEARHPEFLISVYLGHIWKPLSESKGAGCYREGPSLQLQSGSPPEAGLSLQNLCASPGATHTARPPPLPFSTRSKSASRSRPHLFMYRVYLCSIDAQIK